MEKRTRRVARVQEELFATRVPAPRWPQLPAGVRERATWLLAKLLREHRNRLTGRAQVPEEGRDE